MNFGNCTVSLQTSSGELHRQYAIFRPYDGALQHISLCSRALCKDACIHCAIYCNMHGAKLNTSTG